MPNLGYSILPTEDRSPFSSPGQISVPTFSSSTTPKQFRRARLWSIFRRLALFAVLGVLFFEFGARSGGSSSLETANKLWSSAVGDRRSPTHNSGWVLFDDRFDSPYLRRYTTTAPVSQNELLLTEACRDLWISRLQICPQLQKGWLPGKSLLRRSQRWDIVHTWQNGSATLQQQARTQAINDSADRGDSGNAIRHFREHDELRYSLRSVFKAYGKHVSAIDNFYVISTDLPSNNKGERIGMVPSWMDIEHPFHQQASVTPVFPWQIHKSSAFDAPQEAERWRAETLPVFNSMAVESQFANVPTGNDIWLMSCDDFFLLNSHTPSDVFTPLFGPILRLRYSNMAQEPELPSEYNGDRDNELQSLRYAGWLLGRRFGERQKYLYIEHIHKTYSKPLLREMESVWAEELRDAGSVPFRGRGNDLNMHSLFIHFVIERHREAMLYSALILKTDANHDGYIDQAELDALLNPIGASSSKEDFVIPQPRRKIPVNDLLAQAGLPEPLETRYAALSANGYALSRAEGQTLGKSRWVNYDSPGPRNFCTLQIQECFPMASEGSVRWEADSVFKRVAFEQPQCGDCLIMGLLGISGLSGLEAFLPSPKDDTYGAVMSEAPLTDTPVLPLTKSWRDADYSMRKNVPSDMTVRSFATRLLLRYSYVMGHEGHRLLMIKDEESAREKLGAITPSNSWIATFGKINRNPSFLAVNDDIEQDENKVESLLTQWFQRHWPAPLDWELDH